jgi:ribosomal protein S18 acetylase RimI-like enzyme
MKTNCVVKLGQLRRTDLRLAALILGRAMRDNPAHVRAFAISDAERRRQALERFFRPVLLGLHQRGLIYGAYRDNALVGICGIARPGFCQPTPLEKLRLLPAVVFGNPLGTALRVRNWADAWAHRDPAGRHWHLGPVAIEPCVQRQGIGSALLTAFCLHMDAYGAVAYLETDRRANVPASPQKKLAPWNRFSQITQNCCNRYAVPPSLERRIGAVEKPTLYSHQLMYLMSSTSFPFSP